MSPIIRFFASFVFALFALSTVVNARIVGFTGPSKPVKAGSDFEVTFTTQDYISSNTQFYALFGISSLSVEYERLILGQLLGNGYDLVTHNHYSTAHGSFKVKLQVPSNFSKGSYRLSTVVFGTVGADESVTTGGFNSTITITNK